MLARRHRLTDGHQFATVLRRGRRAGSSTLVVHLAVDEDPDEPRPPQIGLVVGKVVGGAVARNQVKRRLRHLVRERVDSLPGGSLLVIRALPPAGAASSRRLGSDLDSTLARVVRQGQRA